VTARFKANHWPSPAQPKPQLCKFGHTGKVTVTVTEALVLRPPLEDRGCITESICILLPVDRMKQNVFRSRRNKSVDRSSFSSVGSLFHARSAATEKALSPIRQCSVARRGCHMIKHAVKIDLEYWQPMSEGLRYIPAYPAFLYTKLEMIYK